jgi:Putative restriction endonuclease
MSVAMLPVRDGVAVTPPRLYRFTVDQYHRMVETGILTGNDRVELLEGWIVSQMPHKPLHDGTVTRVTRRLTPLLPEEWLLRVQSAITLSRSEPEPDLAIVRGPEETYFRRHPGPRDIALLIEVADSSLLHDRRSKGAIYASARISQYWIINLVDTVLEVYSQPRAGRTSAYRGQKSYGIGESVPLVLDGRELARIPVNELLP